jgi:catechol 2,3-dioxygenase-like lactoylglutathione lyase family enzyme
MEVFVSKPIIREVKSLVLTSDDIDRTARFYRDVLDLPLELERHRGTERHYACQLGSIHVAIHDRATFWLPTAAPPDAASVVVSFTVDDLEALLARLDAMQVEVVARRNIGPMTFVSMRDPDGRHVCCGTPWPGT